MIVTSIFLVFFEKHYFLKLCGKSWPFRKWQILESSKLKDFADDNFKVDENARKFSNVVGNTVRKREIAFYKQFLLFPQCFPKTCAADT